MWYLNPIKPINQTARNGAGDRQNQLTKPTRIVGLCIIASKLAIYCAPAHLKFLHLKAEKKMHQSAQRCCICIYDHKQVKRRYPKS